MECYAHRLNYLIYRSNVEIKDASQWLSIFGILLKETEHKKHPKNKLI